MPCTCARSWQTGHSAVAKDAAEPRATRVSMLGAPWTGLKAADKELLVDDHDDDVSSICKYPLPHGCPSKAGSGQPHIMCPMEVHQHHQKISEAISGVCSFGVSWSFKAHRRRRGVLGGSVFRACAVARRLHCGEDVPARRCPPLPWSWSAG